MSKVTIDQKNPPLVVLLTVEHLKKKACHVEIEKGNGTSIRLANNDFVKGEAAVSRYLGKLYREEGQLYGTTSFDMSQVDNWLDFSTLHLRNSSQIDPALHELNQSLAAATHLVGYGFTLADFSVWAALQGNSKWTNMAATELAPSHVARWYKYCAQNETFQQVMSGVLPPCTPHVSKEKGGKKEGGKKEGGMKSTMEEGGKFFDLPGASKGNVCTRFPPEASGYLHIGHAKAALMNQFYKDHYEGKLIMRFDDTNPAKENAEFEKIILKDIQLLNLTPDVFTRTSDHFEAMLVYAEQMIRQGDAYCDSTPAEEMKSLREQKLPSPMREQTVETTLAMWTQMQAGTAQGLKTCLRAKIEYASDNGCLRDPVMYRCRNESHVMTGDKYCVYPTYDFACPIVDSLEGVTHALRTTEYLDRDDQYYWFIQKLGIRKPLVYSYSRLALINTVLSKRKLTHLVDEGYVDSWDDPRMPTVRGVLRRGMTIEGLKEFIIAQGASKSNVHMGWDKIWAFNKKVIDPIAPRYNALQKDSVVPVTVAGANESQQMYPAHPKNASIGEKQVYYSPSVLIEGEDAASMKEGDLVTFINWGNLRITGVEKNADGRVTNVNSKLELENKDFKKTTKITWLSEHSQAPHTPARVSFFDNLISKDDLNKDDDFKDYISKDTRTDVDMIGDPCLKDLKKGDVIQLQRRGYFICDEPYEPFSRHSGRECPCVLFHIPDGSIEGMMNQKKDKPKEAGGSSSSKKQKKQAKVNNPTETAAAPAISAPAAVCGDEHALYKKVFDQGEKLRALKSAKAPKDQVTVEVNTLKALKSEYKSVTGKDYVAGAASTQQKPIQEAAQPAAAPAAACSDEHALYKKVFDQGEKLRALKSAKAPKDQVTVEVNTLKALKSEYKTATGKDYVAGAAPTTVQQPTPDTAGASASEVDLYSKVSEQGDKLRKLKAEKAPKDVITSEVNTLKALKAEYKSVTGKEYVPGQSPTPAALTANVPPTPASPAPESDPAADALKQRVVDQGEKIRVMKSEKADKTTLQPQIDLLLQLKAEYKEMTGMDAVPAGGSRRQDKKKEKKTGGEQQKPAAAAKEKKKEMPAVAPAKGQTRLGLEAKKEENLSDWYSQVITKSELIEYYDVSGCYILRPWAYSMWEKVQAFFDKRIKSLGVKNCYFPMFVSQAALEKEKEHIADFAPEVAWVTKSGDSDLAEPIAIRPTSETVMYPTYSKWVQSHRDLPIKLNQWCNVVRWEFKHPQPFLRTREFLWQEGHTAFATRDEATKEVYQILNYYASVYEDLLAIPVVRGRKTEKEKFAGGDFTTTVEAYISASGRAIQGATSHHLGQNFSKMFNIAFEDPTGESKQKMFAHQNSWGITTRTLGVVVMVHGDNKGLVLPPRVADLQVVIVPVGLTASTSDAQRREINETCDTYAASLVAADIRVMADHRDNYSPGWKFNHWEVKGVPLRIELGPRDIKNGEFVAVRRDTGEKLTMKKEDSAAQLSALLETIQTDMYARSTAQMKEALSVTTSFAEFQDMLERKKIIQAPFCGEIECEENVKRDSARDEGLEPGAPSMGAKSLCIPFEQPAPLEDGQTCFHPDCDKPAKYYTLFGRSY